MYVVNMCQGIGGLINPPLTPPLLWGIKCPFQNNKKKREKEKEGKKKTKQNFKCHILHCSDKNK